MDGEAQRERAAASWENGTLAPVDRLRSERADSPTPGLVEGTEPGEAGPHLAPFTDCQNECSRPTVGVGIASQQHPYTCMQLHK